MRLTRVVCAVIKLATEQGLKPTYSFILGATERTLEQTVRRDMLEAALVNLCNTGIIQKQEESNVVYYTHMKPTLYCGSLNY